MAFNRLFQLIKNPNDIISVTEICHGGLANVLSLSAIQWHCQVLICRYSSRYSLVDTHWQILFSRYHQGSIRQIVSGYDQLLSTTPCEMRIQTRHNRLPKLKTRIEPFFKAFKIEGAAPTFIRLSDPARCGGHLKCKLAKRRKARPVTTRWIAKKSFH